MPIPEDRWHTVAPTEFPHEQEAFDYIKERLNGVVGAWSNFEFIEPRGKVYEVDLLLLTVTELFLIEIKSWSGVLDGTVNNLVRYTRGNPQHRRVKNPLNLTNLKAKVLRSMLSETPALRNFDVPFIQPILFFNNVNLDVRIPRQQRKHMYHRQELVYALAPKPNHLQDPRKRMDKNRVTALGKAFEQLGITAPRRRTLKIGEWIIQELLEEGELYQDHKAAHQSLGETYRRVRTFAVPKGSSAAERALVARAALREFKLTDSLHHPGILKPYNLVEHEMGPALIFPYETRAERMDHYLAERENELSLEDRLDLLRQLADVLRYTHARRVYHRGLAPQSILVNRRSNQPEIQVMDWQTGMEQDVTAGTSHIGQLMTRGAKAYLSPEAFHRPGEAEGYLVDVFGWGTVAFHVLTGQPGAQTQAELYEKLQAHPGLRLSTVTDGLGAELERLVEECTHPLPHKRPSDIESVLERLDQIAAGSPPEEEEQTDPLEAQAGDTLAGEIVVKRRLGKGAMSLALEVEHEGQTLVLKVPHSAQNEAQMRREAEALESLNHPNIVSFKKLVEIGERVCILMQFAGHETLARRLTEHGPLSAEMLERWGEDLLKALVYLEEKGIRHRDIKPANLGVAKMGKDEALHLRLFDFSLAGTSDENIDAGTCDYLDPFLQNRRRWDTSADRYSAGVTLHEMATNILPKWGDGTTHPGLDQDAPLVLEAERLIPALREPLTAFFQRALARSREERFDNAEEMLKTWREIFRQGATTGHEEEQNLDELEQLLQQASLDTTLASLGLEVRLLQAAERLGAHTVRKFFELPTGSLHTAAGLGNQTRKRLVELQTLIKTLFEEDYLSEMQGDGELKGEDHGILEAFLVQLVDSGNESDPETRQVYLGLGLAPEEMLWPSLARVCKLRNLEPMKLARRVPEWRKSWAKLPSLKFLRDEVAELLEEKNGVATAEEVALGLLARHGSFSNDKTRRMQLANALARAAAEAEQTSSQPRFLWERIGTQPVLAHSADHTLYLKTLAEIADRSAGCEPLEDPTRVTEELRAVPAPFRKELISLHRLRRLAAACSDRAAVSSREEFYPRGMEPKRALVLAHGALLGPQKLTPDEIRTRVLARYPESTPLPDRRELDDLLRHVDPDLEWVEAEEAYKRQQNRTLSTDGTSLLSRRSTTDGTRPDGYDPDVAEARRFEDLLRESLDQESFLVLMAEANRLNEAEKWLQHRFPMPVVDLNSLLIQSMKQKVAESGGAWDAFLGADSPDSGEGWAILSRHLVPDAMRLVEQKLLSTESPQLLKNPGLMARYKQMHLFEKLRERAGAREGLSTVWLLIGTEDTSRAPAVDGAPIPLLHGGQKAVVNDAWLSNLHRGAKEKSKV